MKRLIYLVGSILLATVCGSKFSKMVNNPERADVIVRVKGDENLYAHASILALVSSSQFFETALSKAWNQNSEEYEIDLTEFDKDTVLKVLEFIYTSDIDDFPDELIVPVAKAADYLDFPALFEHCFNHVQPINSIEFFKLSFSASKFSVARVLIEGFPSDWKTNNGTLALFDLSEIRFILSTFRNGNLDLRRWNLLVEWSKSFGDGNAISYIDSVIQSMTFDYIELTLQDYNENVKPVIEALADVRFQSEYEARFREALVKKALPPWNNKLLSNEIHKKATFEKISKFILEKERPDFRNAVISKTAASSKRIIVSFESNNTKLVPGTVKLPLSIEWTRLFRTTEHGRKAASFHDYCDNQGPTVIVLSVNRNGRSFIVVGYSGISWQGNSRYVPNPKGFIAEFSGVGETFLAEISDIDGDTCINLCDRNFGPSMYMQKGDSSRSYFRIFDNSSNHYEVFKIEIK